MSPVSDWVNNYVFLLQKLSDCCHILFLENVPADLLGGADTSVYCFVSSSCPEAFPVRALLKFLKVSVLCRKSAPSLEQTQSPENIRNRGTRFLRKVLNGELVFHASVLHVASD